MNELEKKFPLSQERRDQIQQRLSDSSEGDTIFGVDNEEANNALDVLWRWVFALQRDAEARRDNLKAHCEWINRQCNQSFDWRNDESGQRLAEQLECLRQFEYSMENMTTLFDAITDQSEARDEASAPSRHTANVEDSRLSAHDFYRPILRTLQLAGGFDKAKTVLQFIRQTVGSQTNDTDFLRLATPHITAQQWRLIAYRAAKQMTQKGLLLQGSPRGEWTISPEGEKFLEEAQ